MCTVAGCESKLRTLRAAAPHYLVLPTLLVCMQLLYTMCMCHLFLEILSLDKFLIQQECTKIRIFNPRCACAARVMVLGLSVCMCVCVSVCLLNSWTTGNEAACERYTRLQRSKRSKNNLAEMATF